MASINQWNDVPRIEPYVQPVNGIVQPAVIPPPNRPGRRTNVLDMLKQVVNAISRKRWAVYFRKPVDSFALGVPQYHAVIRRPMDLGTIKKRLDNNYYCQAAEAIEDITLIIENCLMFNMEGTVVHQAGEEMKVLFHNLLAKIDLTNEVEVMPKPKPGKRKKASEEKPPSGHNYPAVDPPQSQFNSFCVGVTSVPNLSILNPVPNEMEVEVKATRSRRKTASEEKPPSGHKDLAVDPLQSQSESFYPVTSKPKLQLLAKIDLTNEEEVMPKTKPGKRKKASEEKPPSGHNYPAVDPPQSQSKPQHPSLKPAAYLPNQMKVEVEEKPKPKSKSKSNSKANQYPSGREGFAPDPHQSQFNSFCVGVTSEPNLPILNPVPNKIEVKVMPKPNPGKCKNASAEKPPSGHKDFAVDPHQFQSKPKLSSLKPADPVPHEIEGEVKPKFGKCKIAAQDNPFSSPKDLAADPHQSQSKPKHPSQMPDASLPNQMKVEVDERPKPKAKSNSKPIQYSSGREGFAPDPHQSQFNSFCVGVTSVPNLPILNPVPNEVEVKEKAKRGKRKKTSEEKPLSGHKDLADPNQSQSKPKLQLLANIDLTNEEEVMPKPKQGKRKKASEEQPPSGHNYPAVDPLQSQSKPKQPSLKPAASLPDQMKVDVEEKPKPKPNSNSKPNQYPSGREGFASDPHQSQLNSFCVGVTSVPNLPILNPVPNEMEVEVKEKAKRGKRKKTSKEKPLSGHKDLAAGPNQSQSQPQLPSLDPKVSVPNERKVEVEVKTKLGKRPRASEENPFSGLEDLTVAPHQSQSKPKYKLLAMIDLTNEEEVMPKPKPSKRKKASEEKPTSGYNYLAADPEQSKSKSCCPDVTYNPKLPSPLPAASVSNEIELEVKPKLGKRKKASEKNTSSGIKDLAADTHHSRSKRCCHGVTSQAKLPSLQATVSVPNQIEVEVEELSKLSKSLSGRQGLAPEPQQPQSKSFWPDVKFKPEPCSLNPAASVPNEMEVKVKAKRGKSKKASKEKTSSRHKNIAAEPHQTQSNSICPGVALEPKLSIPKPAASVPDEMEVEVEPKSKSGNCKGSEEKPSSGHNYLAADPQKSQSKRFCPDITYNPKLPSLMPAASVSNEMKVEMKNKAKLKPNPMPGKSPSGHKDLAAVTHQPQSKSNLPILEPAASVLNKTEIEVRPKHDKRKKASEKKPLSGHWDLSADPLQPQSKSLCPDVTSKPKLPSLMPAASFPIMIKEEPEERAKPNPKPSKTPAGREGLTFEPHQSQSKPNLPSLMPAASVPIRITEEVEEKAMPKPHQSQYKFILPSLMPAVSVPIKIKVEVEEKAKPNPKPSKTPACPSLRPPASVPIRSKVEVEEKAKSKPHQSQYEFILPSLMPAASVPIQIKEELEERAKPNPKSSKTPAGREGIAPETHQSQSKPNLSSLMPTASVPMKIKEEVEEKAKPVPKPKPKPGESPLSLKDLAADPNQPQSRPSLSILEPAASVPNEMEMEVKAKRGKRKEASDDKPPSGHRNLAVDPLQSHSESFYPVTSKPKHPRLMPPASVPIVIKEEVEENAKPNPKPSRTPTGRDGLAFEPHQSHSKPNLPSLTPTASVPIKIKVEVEEKAKPKPYQSKSKPNLPILEPAASVPNEIEIKVKGKRGKRKKASTEKSPSDHTNLVADLLQSQSENFCPDVTFKPKLPSLMPAAFVPIKIKKEPGERVDPHQSQSKPNLAILEPAASVPIKVKEEPEERAKPNPKPSKTPACSSLMPTASVPIKIKVEVEENAKPKPHQTQSKPNLPSLMPTASVPIKIKVEPEERVEPHQSQSKPNLPSLMPGASVPIKIKEEPEGRAKPNPKPSNTPTGRDGLAFQPHQSQSKSNLPSLMPAASVPIKIKEEPEERATPNPKPSKTPACSSLMPPASVPIEIKVEVEEKAKPKPYQSKSKPNLPILEPAASVPNEMEMEVKAKRGKRKEASDDKPPSGHRNLAVDPLQSHSESFYPVTSKPKHPRLMPPASVPIVIKEEVEENAKPNPKPSRTPTGRDGLAFEPHQSQSKPNLPSLMPTASVPIKIKVEPEKRVESHQSQSKPNLPSLMPGASVPIKIKEEPEERAKPNPKPSKTPTGRDGLAFQPHQSQSKSNLSSLMPAASVPIKIKEEPEERATPNPKPSKTPACSSLMPPASVPIEIKVEVEEKAKPKPYQSKSKPNLPILEPAASVPNEIEMKVKAKRGKRKKASTEKSPSDHTNLVADLLQSQSENFCPDVTFKPKLPSLMPAAFVPINIKEEPEERVEPHQSQSKPNLAILEPAASVPIKIKKEPEERAKPNPKPSKTPACSSLRPPASIPIKIKVEVEENAKPKPHQTQSKPKHPSLMPTASVPIKIKVEPEERVESHQSQSKPNLPSLMQGASVPIKIKEEPEERAKPNPKPSKTPTGRDGLAFQPHQSQSKSNLPSLMPAASVPIKIKEEPEERATPNPKPSKTPACSSLMPPASVPIEIKVEVEEKAKPKPCQSQSKSNLSILEPAASVPNEMEVKLKAKLGKRKKASEKKPLSGRKDADPHNSRSKRLCPGLAPKPKLPSLKLAASMPNGMEGDEKVKAKPDKKVSEEKPSADRKDNAADLLQSWLKRFCPGVLPSKEPLPLASVPKALVDPTMPPPPPLRWSLRLRFKQTKRMIERSHCRDLLRTMRAMTFHSITWIFNSANYWIHYSQNKDYDYKAEQNLDWPTLAHHVRLSHFKSLDSFVALAQQMFKNGLRCFPEKGVIRSNIKKTIWIFHLNLHRRKKLIEKEKYFARAVWTYQFWKPEIVAAKALKSTKPGAIVKLVPVPSKPLRRLLNPQRRRLNLSRASRTGKRKKTSEKKPPPAPDPQQSQSEGSCPGVTCELKHSILEPAASVPNEIKVEEEKKAKPKPKRSVASAVTSKPKLPSLIPAAFVTVKIKEEVEEKAKPNPKPSKSLLGREGLAPETHQPQSRPSLPILEPAASVSQDVVMEVKAKRSKRAKRKKALEEKPSSGHRNLAVDPLQSQSESFYPVTSKPKLPSLMPAASVPIRIKEEVEKKARSKPNPNPKPNKS